MREIKFRVWDKSVGLIFEVLELNWISETKINVTINYEDGSGDFKYMELPVEGALMQYTGLKDKNGKEIYEGDSVKSLWQHNGITNYDYEVIGEIKWSADIHGYIVEFYNDKLDTSFQYPLYTFEREELIDDEFEIIGNIYENPELLTVV